MRWTSVYRHIEIFCFIKKRSSNAKDRSKYPPRHEPPSVHALPVVLVAVPTGAGVPPAALRHPPTLPPPAVAAAADTCELQNESYVSVVVVVAALCTPSVPAPAGGAGAVGMSNVFLDGRKEEDGVSESAGLGGGLVCVGGVGTGVGVRRAGARCEGAGLGDGKGVTADVGVGEWEGEGGGGWTRAGKRGNDTLAAGMTMG